MGRKSRLKKQRQHDALASRYDAGEFEVPVDPQRAERLSKARLVTSWAAAVLTIASMGIPGFPASRGAARTSRWWGGRERSAEDR
jgi:hypothetical protein